MAKILESYPILNEEIISLLNPSLSIRLSFYKNGVYKDLIVNKVPETDFGYYLDNSGEWNPSKDSLHIDGKLLIGELDTLFTSNQIADINTTIGVAMNCVCKSSKYNVTKSIGEFNFGDNNVVINYDLEIDKQSITQKLEIEFFLYVKEVENESIFASLVGSHLGTVCLLTMDIEGSGSIFPIKYIFDQTKPLWSMNLNYDTLEENFSMNTVCIKINKKHKDYAIMANDDIDSSNYFLWKEILSSFFVNILLNSKDEFDGIKNNVYDDGTVGCFVSYLVDSFKIDKSMVDNPIILSEHIRLVLDKIIK